MVQLSKNTLEYTLNNGVKIPAVGLGTWQSAKNDAYTATVTALKNGYKHIDTAAIYGNEEEVGQGIIDSKVDRKDIFVTTKLWNADHKQIEKALQTSLDKLKLDYVDLYLIHWPCSTDPATKEAYPDWNFVDTYIGLQKLVDSGKVRAIGVSNFTLKKLQKVFDHPEFKIVPAVNQIEAHPLLKQQELFEFLNKHNILIEAYSPLGSTNSPLFKNKTINEIATKNNVEPAQVLISWAIKRGTVVLPKSVTDSRIISNLETFDLSEEDFSTLNKLEEIDGTVRTCDPGFNDFST
jgi:glycerol 2-dehydrogenase (NADP+)